MKKITLIAGNIVYLVILNGNPIGQIKIEDVPTVTTQLISKGFTVNIKS